GVAVGVDGDRGVLALSIDGCLDPPQASLRLPAGVVRDLVRCRLVPRQNARHCEPCLRIEQRHVAGERGCGVPAEGVAPPEAEDAPGPLDPVRPGLCTRHRGGEPKTLLALRVATNRVEVTLRFEFGGEWRDGAGERLAVLEIDQPAMVEERLGGAWVAGERCRLDREALVEVTRAPGARLT